MSHKQSKLPVMMAGLVLLVVLAFVGMTLLPWGQPPNPQGSNAGAMDAPLARRNTPVPLELQNSPEPEPEPGPEPEPEPEPDLTPVVLAPMTLFRAQVKEADYALALRDEPEMGAQQVWEAASTLDQLDSRFAPYAKLRHLGKAAAEDDSHFKTDATKAFENPDVAAGTYIVEAAPRVAIWQREGAQIPGAETVPPAGVSIPLTRRLQEAVSVDIAAGWLKAIEGEYGAADFGPGALPLDIVLFPDLRNYLEFSERRLGLEVPQWSAGFYSSKWDVVCIPVLENTSLAEVVRHEMFHALQAHKAPQSLLVPWFAEGSAEWLDKLAPDGRLRTHPTFAAAAHGYLRTLIAQGLKLDLKAFLDQDLALFYQNPELNYLIAYCFVDFVRGEEDLRAVYFEFWRLMCEGAGHENAFDRSFGGLDMAELQRRFLEKINSFPAVTTPPRFSHDAPAEYFELVPRTLGGFVAPPAKEGEVSQGWFKVLGELREKGFDTSRAGFVTGDVDLLVLAVDHSESMGWPISTPSFDFDALSRWLFSLRYAGTLQFTRKSPDGSTKEEVPAAVLLTMVDAVLTDRVQQFIDTAGIKVSVEIQDDIKESYAKFELSGEALTPMAKREIARHTAESVAWYWTMRQDQSTVKICDFNTGVSEEKEVGSAKPSGFNTNASPLVRLFAKTAGNAAPEGSHGADTDWWIAFKSLQVAAGSGTPKGADSRVACMFFTDGPNSMGFYGHMEDGRNDENYFKDQETLAAAFAELWKGAELDRDDRAKLQIFALPGAEGQGLDLITQKVAQAKLDEWTTHFVK